MSDLESRIRLSAIDSVRFGIQVARVEGLSGSEVAPANAWCEARDIDLLLARCSTDRLDAAHTMERSDYLLMGCLLTYEHRLDPAPQRVSIPGIRFRVADPGDQHALESLACEAFRAHGGHYHADPRLDRDDVLAVYTSWAASAALDLSGDSIAIVACDGDSVVGFATASKVRSTCPVGGVAGVAGAYRGRGIYRALVAERLFALKEAGAVRTLVSADAVNPPSQNCWTAQGYRLLRSEYTFHRWF